MADSDRSPGPAAGLTLTCRPGKNGNTLLFPYKIENRGQVDVYAMHAMASVDPESGEAKTRELAAVVILGPDSDAFVGKFAAPLPTDRRVAVPIFPLARRVEAGGTLEAQLEISLPLAETSPYFADLTLRDYEIVDLKGVIFTIGYWIAGADGLVANPADYAPDLYSVVTRNTMRSARRLTQRFPTSGLQLFRRKDAFPRAIA